MAYSIAYGNIAYDAYAIYCLWPILLPEVVFGTWCWLLVILVDFVSGSGGVAGALRRKNTACRKGEGIGNKQWANGE